MRNSAVNVYANMITPLVNDMAFPLCLPLVLGSIMSSLQDQTIREVDRRLLLNDPQTIQVQLEAVQKEMQTLKTLVNTQQTKIQLMDTLVNSQQTKIQTQETLVNSQQSQIQSLQSQLTKPPNQGAVYTIWGRKSCPLVNGTTTLYTGITGGKMYYIKGSGVTTLCLPHDPDSLLGALIHIPYDINNTPYIFGAEFEMNYKNVARNDDVPCAVCHAQTSTSAVMIPAKLTCPQNWKLQYSGMMSAERSDHFASDFICVDLNPEYIEGTRARNADGRLIHPAKARCGSLPCPPYKDKQYVSCVVCAN
ncbi:uncharacterized protein LOC125662611 [Ostrea edulis]|uniref:uncharacterized protein LOC125662611 n=1 Tax=Ostrea edulis TaxID=37623 RepID=UPI0024AEF628|nr:uncharacterized protein LOC125662611 [Ostrea edulis]